MSIVERERVAAPAPVETDDVAACLERAADILSGSKWCQGNSFDHRTTPISVCARGAILLASENQRQGLWENAEDRLAAYLRIDSVPAWNDTVAESKEQVVRALNEAACVSG